MGGKGNHVLWYEPNEYAMVVIDESHAYRNPDTGRARTLRQLLAGSPPKQVVLMTATPVNNSLWDLYYLLTYFIRNDGAFLHAGIPSLREHFKEANAEDPDDLSPDKLFDVLDAVAVRRTRRFVKRFYPNERIKRGDQEITITFPQPEVLRETYEMDDLLPGFFNRFAHALGADVEAEDSPLPSPEDFDYGEQLTLARYAPSAYQIGGDPDTFELQAAGLLRSGLLKRFESSVYAFSKTCRTMAKSHERFLEALDEGWVLTGDALAAWDRTDSDDFDPEAIAGGRRDPASNYDAQALREAVQADLALLVEFAEEAELIERDDDPKLDALVEALAKIAKEAKDESVSADQERDRRKVIVFSYYADTVEWIRKRLEKECETNPDLAAYRGRLTSVTGSSGGTEETLFGFAPVSSQAPKGRDEDKYDLLVATDVLAEGVNLQQARHIINYDLPWNPMRLVQRHGRIDRIGSPHSRVYLRCFFPAEDLDHLLGLEAALQRKITQAAKSIGVEGQIIPGANASDEKLDQIFAHTKEQIEALLKEDASLFEQAEETGAFSGEEFRRELTEAMGDPHWKNAVMDLPWVAGSGKATDGDGGFVFCARVGDHPRPQYRFVPLTGDGTSIEASGIVDDTLACLGKAVCSPGTERVLPESVADLAYDAWEVARGHIFERWLEAADPANTQPAIPKPMRDAADLLRSHPPKGPRHRPPAPAAGHDRSSLRHPHPADDAQDARRARKGGGEGAGGDRPGGGARSTAAAAGGSPAGHRRGGRQPGDVDGLSAHCFPRRTGGGACVRKEEASPYEYVESLLDAFGRLPSTIGRPPTFLEVAGYPHYENVCSNILAFYMDPAGPHKLEGLLLDALAGVLGLDATVEGLGSNVFIEREVVTGEGNRIDILIESDTSVVLIENKIYAAAGNPFGDYSTFLEGMARGRRQYKLLLTLSPEASGREWGFTNVTHAEFVAGVRSLLGRYVSGADTRYLTMLLDFLNTQENLQEGTRMDDRFRKLLGERSGDVEKLLADLKAFRDELRGKVRSLSDLVEVEELGNVRQGLYREATAVYDILYHDIAVDGRMPVYIDTTVYPFGWEVSLGLRKGPIDRLRALLRTMDILLEDEAELVHSSFAYGEDLEKIASEVQALVEKIATASDLHV